MPDETYRPSSRRGADPGRFPDDSGKVSEGGYSVAGHFPDALTHRRLAEPERRVGPGAAGSVVLVVPEREPGGAARYPDLPAAAPWVALWGA
jgi:hypothetical protein